VLFIFYFFYGLMIFLFFLIYHNEFVRMNKHWFFLAKNMICNGKMSSIIINVFLKINLDFFVITSF
jgi:hypothetical protein